MTNDNTVQTRLHALIDELFSDITPQAKVNIIADLEELLDNQHPTEEELLTDEERSALAEAQSLWGDYVHLVLSKRYPDRVVNMDARIGYAEWLDGWEIDGIKVGNSPSTALAYMRKAIADAKEAQS